MKKPLRIFHYGEKENLIDVFELYGLDVIFNSKGLICKSVSDLIKNSLKQRGHTIKMEIVDPCDSCSTWDMPESCLLCEKV